MEAELRAWIALEVQAEVKRALEERSLGAAGGSEYLTVQEAASMARVHPVTLRNWVRKGTLKAYGAGRRLRIGRKDLETLLLKGPEKERLPPTPEEAAATTLAEGGLG